MSKEELKENILSGYYLTKTGSKYLEIDMSDVFSDKMEDLEEEIKELSEEIDEYEGKMNEVACIVT